MKKENTTKNRRGISSIVGSVFFLIIIVTALGYVMYSMNQLDNFSQAIIGKNQQDRDKAQEDFQIVSATTNNNKFNVTIQNTGMIPINITRVWVENKTDPTWPVSKYSVNQIISPGQILSKVGQNLPLTAKSTQAYGLTFVTDRGNSKVVLVNSASAKPLMLQLSVIPDTVTSGFDTTLLFAVTNNMSNNGGLSNLTPNLSVKPLGASATLVSGPEPSVYPFLAQGNTAYFKWVYSINGSSGQKVNFTASLNNGYLGNFVSKNVTVTTLQGIPTSKTVIGGGLNGTISNNLQNFLRFFGDNHPSTQYASKNMSMPISGTFKNLYVNRGTGTGVVVFTLYKDNNQQQLSCTIQQTSKSCSDTTQTHSFSVGNTDNVAMGIKLSTTTSTGDITFSVEFDPN